MQQRSQAFMQECITPSNRVPKSGQHPAKTCAMSGTSARACALCQVQPLGPVLSDGYYSKELLQISACQSLSSFSLAQVPSTKPPGLKLLPDGTTI